MANRSQQKTPPQQRARSVKAAVKPLSGLSRAAFWSVPATGCVALICTCVIGYLSFFGSPPTNPSSAEVTETLPANKPNDASSNELTLPNQTAKAPVATLDAQPNSETEIEIASQEVAKPADSKIDDTTNLITASNSAQRDAVPKVVPAVVKETGIASAPLMSLTVVDGKIRFTGAHELAFDSQQPSIEKTSSNESSFEHLSFNGVDQAIELPSIPKSQGSVVIVVKFPTYRTSIVFDTDFQRLTLRKNRTGIRWRVAGARKTISIREPEKPFDAAKWHHVAMTWINGGSAVLYVDGVEYDRYDYVTDVPNSPDFEKVVIGRWRGPGERYYPSQIHELMVYESQLSADNVAALHSNLVATYPFIFSP